MAQLVAVLGAPPTPPQPTPQAPQFLASVWRLASQPLALTLSQLPKPPLHAPSLHTPLVQLVLALASVHGVLQPPQFIMLFMTLVSQPLDASKSQSPKP